MSYIVTAVAALAGIASTINFVRILLEGRGSTDVNVRKINLACVTFALAGLCFSIYVCAGFALAAL